jgi:NADH-quinone oxidoreductase subunit F
MKNLTHPSQLAELRARLLAEHPAGQKTVAVSSGTCGRASGSLGIIDAFNRELDRRDLREKVRLEITGCHGFCQLEPNIVIYPEGVFYKNLKPEDIPAVIEETVLHNRVIAPLVYMDPKTNRRFEQQKEIPFFKKQLRLLTEDNLRIDPTRIEDYIQAGGYGALAKVLFDMTGEEVIQEVIASGLRGRGGGGFPTGRKWQLCRNEVNTPRYIICNADEGNPGTFMDRSILVANPHSVVEGLIIGAYAIGAAEGYIYVRMEAPLAVRHATLARDQARKWGLLGKSILGSEFHFDIQIVEGAGAFVCGEETSLMASIEGGRASPRQRPPFPAQAGLWAKPSNINNVETWANVPLIISRGAEWYNKTGTANSKGTKIFSLVGKVRNAGQVEVPMGISLREIIYDIGGGIQDGRKIKAVQTGGPSGGCIPARMLDLTIDYENLVQAGSTMGSGGMIVLDETNCMVDLARHYLHFTQEESCGKCVPCRVGTRQMYEILVRITRGLGEEEDLAKLEELGSTIKTASLCGLGQAAPNPVLSTIRHFRDEYIEHIKYKRCPTLVCREMISAPCHYSCPIGQEAEVYVALVAQDLMKEALEIIRRDNPLPAVCGRVCHHPCEAACAAGEVGQPISIRALKRFVLDWAKDGGRAAAVRQVPKRDERIAVIGSGPAGLTAAHALSGKGFAVTIFEAEDIPGGMLASAIPDHRLPREALKRDIDAVLRSGVTLKTQSALGREISLDGLFQDGFKAVFIATGARKPMKMKIPGEAARGVLPAIEFLKAAKLGRETLLGRRVGVIGGGYAAIDAARVAARDKRCEKVTVFFEGTEEDFTGNQEDFQRALEEGVEIVFLASPVRIIAERGEVRGVDFRRQTAAEADDQGRKRRLAVPGSEFTVELETVILSAGQVPDLSFLQKADSLAVSERGTLVADGRTCATGRSGVFAGGDVVTGPGSVIEAMAAGKRAAEAMERFIEGKDLEGEARPIRPSVYVEPARAAGEARDTTQRVPVPLLSPGKRKKNQKEVELGYTLEQAVREAGRCLRCELQTSAGREALNRDDD